MTAAVEHARHSGAVKVVDPLSLEQLQKFGGAKLVEQMIDLFVSTAPPRLDTAYAAACSGDCAGVRAALHSLKSSAGQLGAFRLQELCQDGETLAERKSSGSLLAIVSAAREELVAATRLLCLVRPGPRAFHPATEDRAEDEAAPTR